MTPSERYDVAYLAYKDAIARHAPEKELDKLLKALQKVAKEVYDATYQK